MKLAFYAPMKSPRHPVPSGDRRMGRLLWTALEQAGFSPELASELRSFDGKGDQDFQLSMEEKGRKEAAVLIARWQDSPEDAPNGWFTYHVYHKAPDWIGPEVCRALEIPYFVAEASHAPKRAHGDWQIGYEAAATAISSAQVVFNMTRLDGECLKPLVSPENRLVLLPPFVDIDSFLENATPVDIEAAILKAGGRRGVINLLTVAMMRSGDKLMSYQQLGTALAHVTAEDWQLLVIGEGEKRPEVEEALAPIGDKAVYLGAMTPEALPAWYDFADLYVWPACGEAYGMAFLEAEGCGLPVVAGNIRGVPDVVMDGKTGLLTPPEDRVAFAAAVDKLLADAPLREKMGEAGQQFVRTERTLAKAAEILKTHIGGAI
ncbi:glycosyltransferase family 4 protein [Sneathiella sp. HT1-7]|uniref:glycosyltransferase family 4 protein n=1 Tax=Sneathiella sp. HT1-7 TaxID=2887192 RepID=UPI001D14DDDE|nr:glycosyltransferase family 4 protein [Sneathiella sp. HT1-7]MCC3304050.1 glycosyltransferase family 4 protein [Sneathiella sp. HT1-7]